MSVKHEFSIILIMRIMTEGPLSPYRPNNNFQEQSNTKNEAQMASDPYQRNMFFHEQNCDRKEKPIWRLILHLLQLGYK